MSSSLAKSHNLREVRVKMGVFDFDVLCVVGKYDDAVRFVSKKFEDEVYDDNQGFVPRGKCFYRPGYVPVIWLPAVPKTPREIATLSHEALHAVFTLFAWAYAPLTRDTEEIAGHTLAHLVNGILEGLK